MRSTDIYKSNSRKVAKNTFYLFIRMIAVMAVGLFTSRVILNTLGVNDYGIYNVVGGIVILFSFLKQALSNATYRYLACALGEGYVDKLSHTFSMVVNAHLIIALIVFFLGETIGLWFLNNQLVFPTGRYLAANIAYQFSILSFCVGVIQTPYNSAVLVHEKMSFYALTSVWEVIFKLIVAFSLTQLPGDKLVNFSWLILAVALFLFLWYRKYCRLKFLECKYHKYWDAKLLREMLKYSGWSILINGTDVAVSQSIVFFFNIFFGVSANAALGIANNVNVNVSKFLQNFTQAFNPQIFKSYAKGELEYFHRLLYSTSKLSYYLLFAVSIPIVLNIDFILYLWLGLIPKNTGTFVQILILYSLIDAYSSPLWTAVHATGNIRTHQIIISSIKILNIPLAYFFIRIGCGAWTALAIKAVLNLICSIVRPVYMKYLIDLRFPLYLKEVIYPIFITTLLSLPLPLYLCKIYDNGWSRLILTSCSFFIILMIVLFFKGLNNMERLFVVNILREKLKGLKKP